MEIKEKHSQKGLSLERVFGITLLLPPLISVLLFILNLLNEDMGSIVEMSNLSDNWTGGYNYANESGGGGFTSAAPIYLGLMAIAGALLLKE